MKEVKEQDFRLVSNFISILWQNEAKNKNFEGNVISGICLRYVYKKLDVSSFIRLEGVRTFSKNKLFPQNHCTVATMYSMMLYL